MKWAILDDRLSHPIVSLKGSQNLVCEIRSISDLEVPEMYAGDASHLLVD